MMDKDAIENKEIIQFPTVGIKHKDRHIHTSRDGTVTEYIYLKLRGWTRARALSKKTIEEENIVIAKPTRTQSYCDEVLLLEKELKDIKYKLQFVVDSMVLEDRKFSFPDGDFVKQSAK